MENQLPFLHSLGLLHRELMTLEDDRRLFMQPIHLRPLGVGTPALPQVAPHPLPAFQPLARRPLPIPALSSPADNPASPAPLTSRGDRDRRRKAKAIARLKSEEATSHLARGGSRPRNKKQTYISMDRQPDLGARSRSTPPSFARDGRWPRGAKRRGGASSDGGEMGAERGTRLLFLVEHTFEELPDDTVVPRWRISKQW
ncbi:hypothetical protein JB92DRAFT_2892581 [Gautieria morchelliformis]|nr:hypothetical protein JB92DRAFT_2892581 [Gautieria morchelliformis]